MADRLVLGSRDKGADAPFVERHRDESDGTYSRVIRSRLEVWDPIGLTWIKAAADADGTLHVTGGTGNGGGGAATVADGADVAQGATTDAAVITDTTGTLSGKLRGLVKWAFERMPSSLGQKAMAASLPVVLASDQVAIPVTANVGTTNGLALDGTLTGGTQKAIARGAAKGATAAADVTSTAEGADHQAVDVQIYHGGTTKDPTATRALTSADVVTAAQGAAAAVAGAWPTKVTDGTSVVAVKAASTAPAATDPAAVVAISPNTPDVGVKQATAANLNAQVVGAVAHDAVDAGNPMKMGGKVIAAAGTPSFVSATGDRVDAAFDGAGRQMVVDPANWTITHIPAANTKATASKGAGAAGVKHVLTSLYVGCQNSGAAAAAMLTIQVRDGATGAGTILWTLSLPILATTLTDGHIFLNDLNIVGSAATAMTVEFSGAGGANTNEYVNAAGYDTL
jgi:hypothetical protein